MFTSLKWLPSPSFSQVFSDGSAMKVESYSLPYMVPTSGNFIVSLPAPLAWKKQVFLDHTLPSPEGLVQNVRFTMGSRNERCRGVGTSGLERPRSLSLKIDPDADRCASRRVVLHLSVISIAF